MKSFGYFILAMATIISLILFIVTPICLRNLENRVSRCEAQLRGITECVNDCEQAIEDIYDELERTSANDT